MQDNLKSQMIAGDDNVETEAVANTEEEVSRDTTEPVEQTTTDTKGENFTFDSLKPRIKLSWKILFSIALLICIGASIYFSFNTLSLDKYEFRDNDDGWTFYAFHNDGSINEMRVEYVLEKDGINFIPNTDKPITKIREYAFCCDDDIEIINIGKYVSEIEDNAFYSCKNLKAVIVDPENNYFCSENGILYNKDKTRILVFPIDYADYEGNPFRYQVDVVDDKPVYKMNFELPATVKDVAPLCFAYVSGLEQISLPAGIETLGTLAFFKCNDLKTIDLPDGLKEIGSDCFSYNKNFTSIYIPASVTYIGHHAFHECSNMTEINVALSKDDFKNVDAGDYWKNITLSKSIKINYESQR